MRALVVADLHGERVSMMDVQLDPEAEGPWIAGNLLAADGTVGPRISIPPERIVMLVEIPERHTMADMADMVAVLLGIDVQRHEAGGPARAEREPAS